MKKSAIILIFLVLIGCAARGTGDLVQQQRNEADEGSQPQVRAQQAASPDPQVVAALNKLKVPSMNRSILDQNDQAILSWMKQIDRWMLSALSASQTGKIDRATKNAIQRHLSQVFSAELAAEIIANFYNYMPEEDIYQALNPGKVMGLGAAWQEYKLEKTRDGQGNIHIRVFGHSRGDRWETTMRHVSIYQPHGNRLFIIGYLTGK